MMKQGVILMLPFDKLVKKLNYFARIRARCWAGQLPRGQSSYWIPAAGAADRQVENTPRNETDCSARPEGIVSKSA